MSVRDKLHDRIDVRERLLARAEQIVKEGLEKYLPEALDATDDIEVALDMVVAEISQDLDELTTEAVRAGANAARARRAKDGAEWEGRPATPEDGERRDASGELGTDVREPRP